MREHWQPTIFKSLEDGSRARAKMVESAREAWPTAEPSLVFLPPSSRGLLTRLPRPWRVACVTLGGAISLAGAACAPTPAPKPSPEIQPPGSSPVLATKAGVTPERVLPSDGEVYFTQGAHPSDGSSTGIKSGIDLAPKRVVNCVPGALPLEEQNAIATASGTITIVGNERDPNDPNYSIVEIQEENTGLRFGVMHLSELPNHVRVGNKIIAGTPIGKASCEVPKGGKTTGIHAHQYVKDQNGQYRPIDGFTFSGWTVQGDTMTRGSVKRVADKRRCNTDQVCDGIRNDLGSGAVLGIAAKPQVPQAPPAPAPAREVPKPIVKPEPTKTPIPQIPAIPWAQFSMGGLAEGQQAVSSQQPGQGFKWIAADLWVRNLTSSWQKFSDSPTSNPSIQARTIDSNDFDHDTRVYYTAGDDTYIPLFRNQPSGIPIPPKGAVRFRVLAQIPATRQPKMFVLQPQTRDGLFHQLTVPFAGGNTPKALFERTTDFPSPSAEATFSCPRDRDIVVRLQNQVKTKNQFPHAMFDLAIHNNGGNNIELDDYLILKEAWSSSGIYLATRSGSTGWFPITGQSIPPDRDGVSSMGAELAYDFDSGKENKTPVVTYPQLVRLTIYPGTAQPPCTKKDILFRIDKP